MVKPPHKRGSDSSATGPPPGRYVRNGPGGQVGGMNPAKRSTKPSEIGSTLLRPASAAQSSVRRWTRSGSSPARSTASEKSTERSKSSQRSSSKVATADGQLFLVEHARADVVRRRLPALVVDGARAHHLEVLRVMQLRSGRVLQDRDEAGPVDHLLGHAVHLVGQVKPGGGHDRRHQVDGVRELGPHGAGLRDAVRPVHDEGRAGAAEPGVALPELVRRVAGPCPGPRVVVVGAESAPVVVVGEVVGHATREGVR